MPKVYNKRHVYPKDAVYVGRPTKWGNPFKIDKQVKFGGFTREESIKLYRQYITCHPELIEAARKELAGKDLVCYCAPLPCHADVLLDLANK